MKRKNSSAHLEKKYRPADQTGQRNNQPDPNKYRIIPPSTEEGYQALKASIADRGPEVPVIRDSEGNTLDGFDREKACSELGLFCPSEVRQFATEREKYALILALHCHRRKPPNQAEKRRLIAAYLRVDPAISDHWLAEIVGGVSKNTVADQRHRLEGAGQIPRLTKLRGKDGKKRPVHSRRIVVANDPIELAKALQARKDEANGYSARPRPRSSSSQDKDDTVVLTSYQCNNDFLIAQVARLYFRVGDRIADVTFGQGNFWKQIDLSQYRFFPSDIRTVPQHRYDFRKLPYCSGDFDVHVFDPPHIHQRRGQPRRRIHGTDYQNKETTKGFSHADIIQLYRDGMAEGYRILKPGGLMLVKCKDEIVGGEQKMSSIEIHNIAVLELGMKVEDQFVLTQPSPLLDFGRSPGHAKKNHSYLWVFRKSKGQLPGQNGRL
jgi:hypothetical protein